MEHFYHLPHMGEDWFTYQKLYAHMVQRFPSNSHFVELGCWKGKSAAFMAVEIINSNKTIRFDCVDLWPKIYQGADVGQPMMDMFIENTKPASQAITIIRKDSAEYALEHPDQSIDFVFIDADHEREGVKRDIQAWLPKMKPNGILAGHDYVWDSVRAGVIDVFGSIINHWADLSSPWNDNCWVITMVDGKPTPFGGYGRLWKK